MENKNMTDNELACVIGGASAQGNNYYTVQKGDSLSAIAKKYHTSVIKLIFLNPQITDPHLIHPGDVIRIF